MSGQFLRPDSEISTVQINTGTYASIDETTPSDADFIEAKKNIIANYRMGMSNPALTVPSGTSTLQVRAANANGTTPSGTPFVTLTIQIYEGASLRASTTQVLTATFTTYSWTPNLAAVTNFNNLEVVISQDAQANRNMLVTWLELLVPASQSLASGSFALTGGALTKINVTLIALASGAFALTGAALSLIEKTFSFGARRSANRSTARRKSFSSKER